MTQTLRATLASFAVFLALAALLRPPPLVDFLRELTAAPPSAGAATAEVRALTDAP